MIVTLVSTIRMAVLGQALSWEHVPPVAFDEARLHRSKAVRKRLGLEKHERIFGTLGLGYPAVRFRNK